MKIKWLIAVALLFISVTVVAQDEETEEKKGFDKDRLFIGGNFGLSFGNYTLINVSPQVGYRFNRFVAAGAGINFIYSSQKFYYTNNDYYKENFGVGGLNVFGRFYPIEYAFVQAQPELNYVWGKRKYSGNIYPEEKLAGKYVPSLLGGVGGAIPMGGRGAFIVMIQYDLLQQTYNPYGSKAFISVGFNF